jgi:hypothetical protein
MRRRLICHGLQPNAQGQALVLMALILTFLMMLIMTCMEVAARYEQRAQIEDALKQATRSAVQAFDYAAFAQDGQLLREMGATSVSGCAGVAPNSARALACAVLATNLHGVSGVQEPPDQTAARVTWTFLPQGGTCVFPNGHPSVTFATPAVCATLTPQMTGLLGWGTWTPQIDAADTLDHIEH